MAGARGVAPGREEGEAMSKPAEPARWIDCGHNECRSRTNVAYGWPCIFAGKYADTIGPLPHQKPVEAASEVQSTHWATCAADGGRRHYDCAVGEIAALRDALKKADEGDVQRVRDITKYATERDDANEECIVLRGILEKNDATIERLEKALEEIVTMSGKRCGSGCVYGEVAAAALARVKP